MSDLLVYGAGGLAEQILPFIRLGNILFYQDEKFGNDDFNGHEVINDLNKAKNIKEFVVAISDIKERIKITKHLIKQGKKPINVSGDDVKNPYHVRFPGNNIILSDIHLEECRIGYGVILNSKCSIFHGVKIYDNSIISPCVTLLGNSIVDENSFIGAGTIIRDKIHIGNNVTIGMGSVVVKNIPDNCVAYGNPCKIVKKL